MNYGNYIDFISRTAGYTRKPEKMPAVSFLLQEPYFRKAFVSKLLTDGIIDRQLADLILTKKLIENYL